MIRGSIVVLAVALFAGNAVAQDQAPLKTQKEKISYALGMDLGKQLSKQSVDVDPDVFARGLKEALAGGKTLLTDDEARALIAELQKGLLAKQVAASQALGAKNAKDGTAFLAENGKKPGVVTLPSGLQYKALTTGTGKKPTIDDTVVCHYRGTLLDGKEFDSSYRRNEPMTIPVKGVIRGWSEALQLMPVGSKWQLFVPPQLAYGERGANENIGPNATLIFEIELISIKGKS